MNSLKELGCNLTPPPGAEISFTFLGGAVEGQHKGKIVVPESLRAQANEILLGAMQGPRWLPLHEMAANSPHDLRVFVTEVDLKLTLTKPNEIRFLADFCGVFLANFEQDKAWEAPTFCDDRCLNLQMNEERIAELNIMDLLDEADLTQECHDGSLKVHKRATWLDILEAFAKRCETINEVPSVARTTWFVKLLTSLFGMAYGSVVREAVKSLYPDYADNSMTRFVAVLTNHGPDAFVANKEKFNFGVHTYSPYVILREPEAHRLIDEIYYIMENRFDGKLNDFIRCMVDRGIYNNGGGLRPPFAQKTIECTSCNGRPDMIDGTCNLCKGFGATPVNRWYAPTALLAPEGKGFYNKNTIKWFMQSSIVMKIATATALKAARPTEGGKFKELPQRTIVTDTSLRKRKNKPAAAAAAAVTRAAKRYGLDPKEDDTEELLATINAHSETVGRTSNSFPMLETSEQFRSLQRNFPGMIAMLFGMPTFGMYKVKSAMIRFENSSDRRSPPVQIYVYLDPKPVAGAKGRTCFNRRPKKTFMPGRGRHRNTVSVFFKINREDLSFLGRASITQACNNTKDDPATRFHGPCNLWEGETRVAEIPVAEIARMADSKKSDEEDARIREIIREWFYPPEQRTLFHLNKTMQEYRVSIVKRYKNFRPHPHIIGPHPEYRKRICEFLDAA